MGIRSSHDSSLKAEEVILSISKSTRDLAETLDQKSYDIIANNVSYELYQSEKLVPSDSDFKFLTDKLICVYVCLRSNGSNQADAWGDKGQPLQSLRQAIRRAKEQLNIEQLASIDTVEVNIAYNFKQIDPYLDQNSLTNAHVGIKGLEITFFDEKIRWSPTEMISKNLRLNKIVESISHKQRFNSVQIALFDSYQLIVNLPSPAEVIPLFRGNQFVSMSDVTPKRCLELRKGLALWMENQLQPTGQMTYKYWPSRHKESINNNVIRQFMATLCLQRLAKQNQDVAFRKRVENNLNYNLQLFYQEKGDIGFIEYSDKRKLGAASIAALAIAESPQRASFKSHETKLFNLSDHLHQQDGSFQTFYGMPNRRDNQNFYPGETLLFWATLYGENHDQKLHDKFMQSYYYYKSWHIKNRNPAFVPWHTMAYYIMWKHTRNPDFVKSIFDMNDWLIDTMQQSKEDVPYPDMFGRFYNPSYPEFGPPHASSTGVYLEGLVDAYRLAIEFSDHVRRERYRIAILRGIRSLLQLQFVDDVDMFYTSDGQRVKGGLRTTVYNNEIRVDNVQHALMAMLKIIKVFKPEDFRYDDQ